MQHIGYFDGASENPGKCGLGATLLGEHSAELAWAIKPIQYGTNNEAEYQAVILLMELALSQGISHIVCRGDSQLVINQINGRWRCQKEELKQFLNQVHQLSTRFEYIRFEWVKREDNQRADALSKQGMSATQLECAPQNALIPQVQAPNFNGSTTAPPTTITPVTVKTLQDGRLLIGGAQIAILDPTTKTCTCGEFHATGQCVHVKALLKLTNTPSPTTSVH